MSCKPFLNYNGSVFTIACLQEVLDPCIAMSDDGEIRVLSACIELDDDKSCSERKLIAASITSNPSSFWQPCCLPHT